MHCNTRFLCNNSNDCPTAEHAGQPLKPLWSVCCCGCCVVPMTDTVNTLTQTLWECCSYFHRTDTYMYASKCRGRESPRLRPKWQTRNRPRWQTLFFKCFFSICLGLTGWQPESSYYDLGVGAGGGFKLTSNLLIGMWSRILWCPVSLNRKTWLQKFFHVRPWQESFNGNVFKAIWSLSHSINKTLQSRRKYSQS